MTDTRTTQGDPLPRRERAGTGLRTRAPRPVPLGRGLAACAALEALLLGAVLLAPFFFTLWSSFLQLDPSMPETQGRFIGLRNYWDLFTREPEFVTSLVATGKFLALALAQSVAGLGVALWIRWLWPEHLPSMLSVLLLLPALLSRTLLALMGRLFFNDQVGIVSRPLRDLGFFGKSNAPLATPGGAWVCMAVLDSWQWVPFTALLFWLALKLLPRRLLEVARVDGLTRWQRVLHVAFPVVSAPLTIIVLLRLLEALRTYDLPQGLTGGGPGTATMTVSIYANRITFLHQRLGLGAAHLIVIEGVAYLLIVVLLGRLVALRRILRERLS